MTLRYTTITVLVVAGSLACSGHDGDGSGEEPQEQPALSRLANVMCDVYERCDLPHTRLYGTGAECRETYAAALAATASGAVPWEELVELYEPCLDALATAECPANEMTAFGVGFRGIAGALEACVFGHGAPCASSSNCGPGYRCSAATATQCGTCVPVEAGTCESELECADGQFCDFDVGRCSPRVPLGAGCTTQYECASNLCLSGACQEPAAVGDACGNSRECELFLNCVEGRCAAPGGVGEACSLDLYACRGRAACADGVCVEASARAGAGAPCSILVNNCDADLLCDFETHRCLPRGRLGESCASSDGCVDGAYCDFQTDTCQPNQANGAACSYDDECVSEFCAPPGQCAAPLVCP